MEIETLRLPGANEKEVKLAKFVTYQHNDGIWFHITRPDPEHLAISMREIVNGRVQTLNLKLGEAYALRGLLEMILERGT